MNIEFLFLYHSVIKIKTMSRYLNENCSRNYYIITESMFKIEALCHPSKRDKSLPQLITY